jgi:hypothetical protein
MVVSKLIIKSCACFLILASETVTFLDCHGDFLLTLHLNMTSGLRSSLIPRFQASFPGHLQVADTTANEKVDVSVGEAIHFSWYNRYSTRVSLIYLIYLIY